MLHQFQSRHAAHAVVGRSLHANVCVPVTVIDACHTFTVIPWIAHKQRFALFALSAYRVVVTCQAYIELIGSFAVGMSIALTLNTAIGSHITKITPAHIRLDAIAPDATFKKREKSVQNSI